MTQSKNYAAKFAEANSNKYTGLKGNTNAKKPRDTHKTAQISAFVTPEKKGALVMAARSYEMALSAIIERVISEWLANGAKLPPPSNH
jgi:hypothetical protein